MGYASGSRVSFNCIVEMMQILLRLAWLFSLASLLAVHGCSKNAPEGDKPPAATNKAEQAGNQPAADAKPKLPPALPDMSE